MSARKQDKAVRNLFLQIWQLSKANSKEQLQWLLRSLLVSGRQQNLAVSGFVLPTVVMVSLVVVLLTTAMMIRSFERSRYASNFRVDETVLNAATPALDRARAKINALLADPTLSQETPTDAALEKALNRNSYVLGDETRLKLVNDIDTNGTIGANETLTTAWRFPVDTDNNGKFDSYTLYGIYFRSPIGSTSGTRNPLAARTSPMEGGLGSQCENAAGTSTSLVGDSGWYKTGAKLTKSFFVYTATVPITTPPVGDVTNYEVYKGNKGFSALEFQQDRDRIPLSNNAAVFQDDLELTSDSADSPLRLNGRISTNGNLLIGGDNRQAVRLFQVSSKYSCFYTESNSKITVGGNVAVGSINDRTDREQVTVDLFNGFGNAPSLATIDRRTKSTNSQGGFQIGYNDAAYNQRIALMKQTALSYHPNYYNADRDTRDFLQPTVESVSNVRQYPPEVKEGFADKINAPGGSSLKVWDVLAEQIEIYLKNRTRRVPYAEVPTTNADPLYPYNPINGIDTRVFASGTIEPPEVWRKPIEVNNIDFLNNLTNTTISLNPANLPQTQPEQQQKAGKERNIGDRISVGNNLPAYWKNEEGNYVTGPNEKQLVGSGINWNDSDKPRDRTTQVIPVPEARIADRNGFWEQAAAQQPATNLSSNVGGLRAIVGAGIYSNASSRYPALNTPSFMSAPTVLDSGDPPPNAPRLADESTGSQYTLVMPDTMPMKGGTDNPSTRTIDESTAPPDLRMRATAVYHYDNNAGTSQTPIACVSSYYDPTDSTTAQNLDGLPYNDAPGGSSNNGVVYPPGYTTDAGRFSAIATTLPELRAQAKLMFPNGRIVNEPLQQALQKLNISGRLVNNNKPLSLSETSAIDTAICAIQILNEDLNPILSPVIPHGAIKEASFLDARQVKAIDKTATNYDLELEQRQPLEVRVTDIDLGLLARQQIRPLTEVNQEYLLPNSGIIYASRDDALLDLSDTTTNTEKELLSPTDFKLDPTRRPNGIRLINGSNLARTTENRTPENNFREEEKGLILATNLPTYIKGDFNLHQPPGTNRLINPLEEFLEDLAPDWSNFYERSSLNNNYACRKGQPGCNGSGDLWRPATIISDAVTVLSGNFQDGFRNEGDYDLRNNTGSSATQARKKNGFFDNNFVTSADWASNNGFPDYRNSYLTNGVTPIQRRTYSPEYVMEICRKLPVSECRPSDWVVGLDINGNGILENEEKNVKANNELGQNLINNGGNTIINNEKVQWFTPFGTARKSLLERLGAGTTARPTLDPEDRRYARRVAFARDEDGRLVFTQIVSATNTNNAARPLGIGCSLNGCEYPDNRTPEVNTNYGIPTNDALWFRTTNNQSLEPGTPEDITYASDKPLYYLPPELSGEKLILPDTPDLPGLPSLNLPEGSQSASDYTVCLTTGGISQRYSTSRADLSKPPGNRDCPAPTNDAIRTFFTGIYNLNSPEPVGQLSSKGGTLTAKQPLNVYELPINTFNPGAKITLDSGENPDAIFVLKATNNLTFGANSPTNNRTNNRGSTNGSGVQLELKGVNPNNVFWVINGSLQTVDGNHELQGNFIGNNGAATIGKNTQITGRILGFGARTTSPIEDAAIITAITSNGQPSLVPVLQIHSPEGSPSPSRELDTSGNIQGEWLQVADDTTVNAVFVSGNSSSRSIEESAGLSNFVRLLEKWDRKTLNIKGSFIQFRRSAFATGPFATILSSTATTPESATNNLSLFDYPFNTYRTENGTPPGTLPYFNAPNREWSFDVGLLSQSPDLFAQNFTQQPVNPANEFFREVSRDDEWIETLLCAAVQDSENNYSYVIDASERPNNCPALTAYNNSPLVSDSGE
jgi:hypothetical protein